MTAPPPLPLTEQQLKDQDHLRLLAIFHALLSALAVPILCFLYMHYRIFTGMMGAMGTSKEAHAMPPEFIQALYWFYAFMAGVIILASVLNGLSALCLRRRHWRTFSLVVAGLNVLQMPIGTALGVFTIMVLLRDSVRNAYAR